MFADYSKSVCRRGTDFSDKLVRGMQGFSSENGLPVVASDKYTDAYGQEVVEQAQALDEYLLKEDTSYQRQFPRSMEYHKMSEPVVQIPGMTVVVGKIDGAPGYVVGYESYDETYIGAQKKIEMDRHQQEDLTHSLSQEEADTTDLYGQIQRTENASVAANDIYDFEKGQYQDYLKIHPDAKFLDQVDPVKAYQILQQNSEKENRISATTIQSLLENGMSVIGQLVNTVSCDKTPENVDTMNLQHPFQAILNNSLSDSVKSYQYLYKPTFEAFKRAKSLEAVRDSYLEDQTSASTGIKVLDELNTGKETSVKTMMSAMPNLVISDEDVKKSVVNKVEHTISEMVQEDATEQTDLEMAHEQDARMGEPISAIRPSVSFSGPEMSKTLDGKLDRVAALTKLEESLAKAEHEMYEENLTAGFSK